MKKFIFTLLLGFSFVLSINTVYAEEINHFYANADTNINFEDTAKSDIALAGKSVSINGKIYGIGFIAGENVTLNGDIDHGFVAGNNIIIKGNINESLYVAGSNITFDKSASVARDIFIAGENVILNGNINHDISGYTGKLTIKEGTIINGNINVKTNNIIIEDNVIIKGTLKYNDDSTSNISNKSDITKIEVVKNITNEKMDITNFIFSIVNIIIVFLVITILLPKTIENTEKRYKNEKVKGYFKSFGVGLLILLCIPIVCLMLLISNIGISLGFIVSAIYGICLYLSYIYAGIILGNLILTKLLKLNSNKYISGIIGILLIKVLTLIPIIGFVVSLLTITIGLDAIYRLMFNEEKNNKKVTEAKVIKEKKKLNK